ncbi:uncharacterized protein LOC112579533 [Bubalus bubalis]|uniref:uncharacterized protein LOC112579533 n=1 Tax=Bubalus bubalis TaxID=89462 RepID=UPI001E1B7851|nr:uncharacterized protein LOC112579533 [Bubalus bubalis]
MRKEINEQKRRRSAGNLHARKRNPVIPNRLANGRPDCGGRLPSWTAALPLQKPIGQATESCGRKRWMRTRWRDGSRVGRRAPRASRGTASGRSIRARPIALATVRVLVPGRASSRPVPSSSPPIRVRCCQEWAESADSPGPAGRVTRRLRGARGKALGLRSREANSAARRCREIGRHGSSATVGRAAAVDWALERLPTQPVGTSARW